MSAPSAIRTGFPRTRNDGTATRATPKTTRETPRKNRPPLLIEGPEKAPPGGIVPRALGTPEAPTPVGIRFKPTGAKTKLKASSITESSWSLADGLGMQLQVGEAKMFGLTLAVAVMPTIPKTPMSTAKAR